MTNTAINTEFLKFCEDKKKMNFRISQDMENLGVYVFSFRAKDKQTPFSFSVDVNDEEWEKIAKGAMKCFPGYLGESQEALTAKTLDLPPMIIIQAILDSQQTVIHPVIAQDAKDSLQGEYLNSISEGAAKAAHEKIDNPRFIAEIRSIRDFMN